MIHPAKLVFRRFDGDLSEPRNLFRGFSSLMLEEYAMAIDVVLQDEWGQRLEYVDYPAGEPNTLIPFDDESFPYLGYIDAYGNTIFNHLQMKPFLIDWQRLYAVASSEAQLRYLNQVEALAQKCQTGFCLFRNLEGE